jgi:signal transduction histidine kinase
LPKRSNGARASAARSSNARAARAPDVVDANDLQSILAGAVQRLARQTATARVAAWSLREHQPFVAAATMARPRTPTAAEFEALAALPRTTRLDGPNAADVLRGIAKRHGFVAAAPVGMGEGTPASVVLLLGELGRGEPGPGEPGPGEPGHGEPRPRLLAKLSSVARAIAPRVASAIATARLAQLDTQVRHLDRLASLGDLVAEIVHEVRNPLVSLKTFLHLLPERIDEIEFRTRFFDLVNGELRRIERLLDVVLSHARPRVSAAETGATDAGAVIESVTRLVAHRALERGVLVETAPEDGPSRLQLGEDALRQVLLNLVLNAIDATPADGRVRLSTRASNDGIEIRVDDEGPGLPAAIRKRIFEPFFSTKGERPGGLGLAISRRIVEEAGGSIVPEAREGGGTSFRVVLPNA